MRVIALQQARDWRDIQKLAHLRAYRLRGERRGQWALNLTGRWRLVVEVAEHDDEVTVVEVSHHYGD